MGTVRDYAGAGCQICSSAAEDSLPLWALGALEIEIAWFEVGASPSVGVWP